MQVIGLFSALFPCKIKEKNTFRCFT